jgi:hypothetical protein
MLTSTTPGHGLLFASFLYRRDLFEKQELISFWENQFGLSFTFEPLGNPLIDYYAKEMGGVLSRFFVITSKTYSREYLLSTKLLSLSWEKDWAHENLRRVNVDVGFLSLENFILSTTKNYSHRIYIGQNIFADLTYVFQNGQFQPLPWTYPDYLDADKKDFLTWGRFFLLQNPQNQM